jgi:hypothetical protein
MVIDWKQVVELRFGNLSSMFWMKLFPATSLQPRFNSQDASHADL